MRMLDISLSLSLTLDSDMTAVCRPRLAQYGEPEAPEFDHNLPTVVGWGRSSWGRTGQSSTQTEVQQKLETPVVASLTCLSLLEISLKLDLSEDLR